MKTGFDNLFEGLRNENLYRTYALFTEKKTEWFKAFTEHFKALCTDIVNMQNSSAIQSVSYLDYTMLYTNFINQRYTAEIWLYGDDWYCDKKQQIVGEYDLSFLFIYFDELWKKLLFLRKRFVGSVSAMEIKSLVLQSLPDFYSFFISIVRFAIRDSLDKKPFIDIIKNDDFRICVGDYMANTEMVFVESKKKDAEAKAISFEKQHDFTFKDYSCLDFSGHSLTFLEFSYSHFNCSCFSNGTLEGSDLTGTNFRKAQMENCCFDDCSIYEADYSYAMLKKASFINVLGSAGFLNKKELQHVAFLPTSFRYAELTNSDFRCSDLTGADFTGAILCGADFTDAVLDGADFTDAVLDGAIFNDGINRKN